MRCGRERSAYEFLVVAGDVALPPILIGGVQDHAHLLARFGRTITQAE